MSTPNRLGPNRLDPHRQDTQRAGRRRLAGLGAAFGALVAAFAGPAAADYGYNLQAPVSPIAREIFDLHMLIYYICLVIFIVVFAVMFYSIVKHRKSKGYQAASFHESTTLEIVWTTIPFLILVGMAIPSTATLVKMEDTRTKADMVVKVTAYQWKWQYEYPEQNISFFSNLATPLAQIENTEDKTQNYLLEVDKPLVLPTGKKVRFLFTSNDVIHAWWVPQLGVKKDAVPGFINESWATIEAPGVYRGQCAELCGKDHGFMPIVVEAKNEADFNAWVAQAKSQSTSDAADAAKQWSKGDLMARGEKVYAQCAACHGPKGQGVPGVFPPLAGSKLANGPANAHINIVLKGKPGTAMAAFGPQLNDVDVAAVVTYERNAFGNKAGDIVQPSQVKALR